MAMKEINAIFSPCEVIRFINDEIQGDTEKDIRVRKLLYKLLKMNKAMSEEIHKHNPKYSFVWREQTPDWRNRLALRISKGYKVDK